MRNPKVTMKKRVAHSNRKPVIENDLLVHDYISGSTTHSILKDMVAKARKYKQPVITKFSGRDFIVYPGYTLGDSLKKAVKAFYDRSYDARKR